MRHYRIQLVDAVTGAAIQTSGGVCYVAEQGGAAKVALKDSDGASASNPSALTNGVIEFYVADTVAAVDLYIHAPSGHACIVKNVAASGPNSIKIDKSRLDTILVIPFSIDDTTANTETDTGFDVPTNAGVMPIGLGVEVLTADSGMTVDAGTLSSASGDADGFMDGLSLTSTGIVKPTLANSGDTMGALLSVQDSANSGDDAPEMDVSSSGKSITYTLSTSTDTGEGFFILPLRLSVSAAG